jgi:hypothetical protein
MDMTPILDFESYEMYSCSGVNFLTVRVASRFYFVQIFLFVQVFFEVVNVQNRGRYIVMEK